MHYNHFDKVNNYIITSCLVFLFRLDVLLNISIKADRCVNSKQLITVSIISNGVEKGMAILRIGVIAYAKIGVLTLRKLFFKSINKLIFRH